MSQVIGDILDFARGRPGAGMLAPENSRGGPGAAIGGGCRGDREHGVAPQDRVEHRQSGPTVHLRSGTPAPAGHDPAGKRRRSGRPRSVRSASSRLSSTKVIWSFRCGTAASRFHRPSSRTCSHRCGASPPRIRRASGWACTVVGRSRETHGGRISVTSTKKYGTQFTVRLPVAPPV